jgi:hypothetical protein
VDVPGPLDHIDQRFADHQSAGHKRILAGGIRRGFGPPTWRLGRR